jgi:hypothetical protein
VRIAIALLLTSTIALAQENPEPAQATPAAVQETPAVVQGTPALVQETQDGATQAQAVPTLSLTPVAPTLAERGPRERSYVEPVPDGYRPVRRVNAIPVALGLATFGISYRSAVTAVIRTWVFDGGDAAARKLPMLVPVVGPFLVRERETLELVFGIGQSLGIAATLVGLLWPRTVLLRKDYRAFVLPTVGPRAVGVAGAF